jgi:bacteriophage HK97-gp10 putative tail-component
MARVRLDRADIRRAIRGASMSELRRVGPMVVNRAKILCPVDTGRLRASIQGDYRRTWTLRPQFTVFSDVEYASMVNDGTRPHVIRPKNASVLRFEVGGRVVYARVVHHPGTRARPFLDRAVREVTAGRGYTVTED